MEDRNDETAHLHGASRLGVWPLDAHNVELLDQVHPAAEARRTSDLGIVFVGDVHVDFAA
jgi:hypothetical protein